MQYTIMLFVIIVMTFFVFFNAFLFYRQDVQPDYFTSFKEKGRIDQFGRTGVAAMHAVLIGYGHTMTIQVL
jgi:hypothetical protein